MLQDLAFELSAIGGADELNQTAFRSPQLPALPSAMRPPGATLGRQLLLAYVMMATNTCVWAQDIEKGRTDFLSYCAGCHGADGKGAGRMSSKLEIKPADLTVLAKKNNDLFSSEAVAKRIDGRSAPHRKSEMPIWGCRHGPPPGRRSSAYKHGSIDSLLDLPCDPEEVIQKRIRDIVGYLAQIQQK